MSGAFFQTVGVRAAAGRLLTPEDDVPGCASPGVVVSHSFWQRELAGDPSAVGRTLRLDGMLLPVVGVTAAGFHGIEVGRSYDVAVPAVRASPVLRVPAERAGALRLVAAERPRAAPRGHLARAGECAAGRDLARDLRGDGLAQLAAGDREEVPGPHARRRPRRNGVFGPPQRLREAAVGPAGHDRAGAAHRLREPGQPDAGPRHRAGARDRGAPRHRRVARTHRASADGGERAAGGRRAPRRARCSRTG